MIIDSFTIVVCSFDDYFSFIFLGLSNPLVEMLYVDRWETCCLQKLVAV